MTTMYEATQTISRTTQAPLGLVWIKGTQHVLALGLEQALGAEARLHTGYEGPKAQTPSAVIYLQEDLDGEEEELAQEIESIRAKAPHATILVCTPAPDLRLARGALKAGASGLLYTGMPPEQILRALSVARRGELVLPRELLRLWVDEQQRLLEPRIDLSARRREVLELVVEGLTNAEIAGRMFLSESTIKQHLRAAYKLFGVKNRTEAAARLRGRRGWGGTLREVPHPYPLRERW